MDSARIKLRLLNGHVEEVVVEDEKTVEDLLDKIAFAGLLRGIGRDYQLKDESGRLFTTDRTVKEVRFKDGELYEVTKAYETQANYIRTTSTKDDFEDLEEVEEPMSFHQLGILVLDGSGSMNRKGEGGKSLANQVDEAVTEFLKYFQNSSLSNNFSFAIITFDHDARILLHPTKLDDIDTNQSFNPYPAHKGGTDIGNALVQAHQLALDHINTGTRNGLAKDAVIIIMSDGECQNADQTRKKADEIKESNSIQIASTFFTNKNLRKQRDREAAIELLKGVSSSQNMFKETFGKKGLRKFFTSSMSVKAKID
ncbi:MAG: vWA domain-containing protein [Bacteroidota bacterium]